ncbi:head-tail connector protein [Paracoccus sp. p3-h83]|uniref:head-tail connector protein n=1 Tax=Paracoccus sp. p3-h83 TaxID=3342805 RepID=UPI0035B9D250
MTRAPVVSLDAAVAHLSLPPDADLLQVARHVAAATRAAEMWLDRALYAGAAPDPLPDGAIECGPDIEMAILTMTEISYNSRDGVAIDPARGLPDAVFALLSPYRRWRSLSGAV